MLQLQRHDGSENNTGSDQLYSQSKQFGESVRETSGCPANSGNAQFGRDVRVGAQAREQPPDQDMTSCPRQTALKQGGHPVRHWQAIPWEGERLLQDLRSQPVDQQGCGPDLSRPEDPHSPLSRPEDDIFLCPYRETKAGERSGKVQETDTILVQKRNLCA
jgi:hypothetical protein